MIISIDLSYRNWSVNIYNRLVVSKLFVDLPTCFFDFATCFLNVNPFIPSEIHNLNQNGSPSPGRVLLKHLLHR
ncbi:hypothetical protein YC2023_121646 [Brassica napus]